MRDRDRGTFRRRRTFRRVGPDKKMRPEIG